MLTKEHPLFPQEGESDPIEVEFVQIFRLDNGQKRLLSLYPIPQEDLQTEAAIFEQYGPGSYELVSRAHNKITRRRQVMFPGEPRGYGPQTQAAPAAAAPTPAVFAQVPPTDGNLLTMIVGLIQQHSQQLQQQSAQFMAFSEQKNQQTMQLLFDSQRAQMAMMSESFRAVQSAQAPRSDAGDPLKAFRQGIDFVREFRAPKSASSAAEEAKAESDTFGQIAGLVSTFLQARQQAAPPRPPSGYPGEHALPMQQPPPPQPVPNPFEPPRVPMQHAGPPSAGSSDRPPGASAAAAAAGELGGPAHGAFSDGAPQGRVA